MIRCVLTLLLFIACVTTTRFVAEAADPSLYFASNQNVVNVYESWYNERGITYSNTVFLPTESNPENGAALFWNINGNIIEFAIAVQATGFVGFGLSSTGGMAGSDLAIFTASEPDNVIDYNIRQGRQLNIDECQDWELISTPNVSPVTTGGFLIYEIKRQLVTGDPQDLGIVNDLTASTIETYTKLIVAWGEQSQPGYHGANRCRSLIRLFDPSDANDDLVKTSFTSLTQIDPSFGTPPADGICPTNNLNVFDDTTTTNGNNNDDNDPRNYFEATVYQNWFDTLGKKYPNYAFLATESNPDNGIAVFWKFLQEDDSIQFGIAVQAEGWVGFGLSSTGGMLGSDIFVFNGLQLKLSDYHITNIRFPYEDVCNDWELVDTFALSPIVADGYIIVEVKRKLNTNDIGQDLQLLDDSTTSTIDEYTKLIAAWGNEDGIDYHGSNRSRKLISLFDTTKNEELLKTSFSNKDNVDPNFGEPPATNICPNGDIISDTTLTTPSPTSTLPTPTPSPPTSAAFHYYYHVFYVLAVSCVSAVLTVAYY